MIQICDLSQKETLIANVINAVIVINHRLICSTLCSQMTLTRLEHKSQTRPIESKKDVNLGCSFIIISVDCTFLNCKSCQSRFVLNSNLVVQSFQKRYSKFYTFS